MREFTIWDWVLVAWLVAIAGVVASELIGDARQR